MAHDARLSFIRQVAGDDETIDLAMACMLIAAHAYPGLRPEPALAELDRLAAAARARSDALDAAARLATLHTVLYRDAGFHGDRLHYSDPRNALLNDVIVRRRGIPITLAIVELEVAWRAGVAVHGIGFPGHFLVGTPDGLIIDPFEGGQLRTHDDLRAMLRHGDGPGASPPGPFPSALLRPATRRGILARMLNNLRGMYAGRHDWASALWTVELLAVLHPHDEQLRRDHAILLGYAGRFLAATRELQRYLHDHPDADDRDTIERALALFRRRVD